MLFLLHSSLQMANNLIAVLDRKENLAASVETTFLLGVCSLSLKFRWAYENLIFLTYQWLSDLLF